jgi:uncharacterized membrane protein YdbT with pleckstrin-like domain
MRTKLRAGEKKILQTRTHWLTVAKPFLFLVLTLTFFIVSLFLLHPSNNYVTALRWASGILLLTAGLNFLYREWYRRRDIWVVTNLRVIDENGVFSLYSKESPLEKINNLSYFQSLWGRLFNFGNVEVQTAAEDGATVYRMVAKPRLLKDTIAECRDEYSHAIAQISMNKASGSGENPRKS